MLKRILIPTLVIAVAVPLMAQGRVKQRIQQRLQANPAIRLKAARKALNLTPDQVNNLKSIRQANRTQRQNTAQDTRQKREALKNLMAQSNPNPTELGNAVLALKQARGQAQQLRQQALNNFKNSLTADQQKTLEELQARRKNPRRP